MRYTPLLFICISVLASVGGALKDKSSEITISPDDFRNNNQIKSRNDTSEDMLLLSSESIPTIPAVSEMQQRLDMIKRSFGRLPKSETDRLGIDLNMNILEGTVEADILLATWRRRQEEIKEAMSSMIKPAEVMGEIAKTLKTEGFVVAHQLTLTSPNRTCTNCPNKEFPKRI